MFLLFLSNNAALSRAKTIVEKVSIRNGNGIRKWNKSNQVSVLASLKSCILWTTLGLAGGAFLKYNIYKRNSNREVLKILIFNELSFNCPSRHVKNQGSDHCSKYCCRRHIQQIIQQIDGAVYAIDIAIYTFTISELLTAFSRALSRGVVIRVITDLEMINSSGSKILTLFNSGAEVRTPASTAMMHHKFLVIDEDSRVKQLLQCRGKPTKLQASFGIMFYGSANWTAQGFNGNWENGVITSDKLLLSRFQTEFDRMWESFVQFSPPKPKRFSNQCT
ncbi:mitochondrial cardiolipin hydrolase [Drosophila navojoa]|uniref:mitochondrial cardiolipin hydrolase n=1 Tax=Drosophila navojoa TaxID=7232 RepID=UPI0011BF54C3|nr:mitochondrial cardiolipin hydrolase [Drosophila navojoa]